MDGHDPLQELCPGVPFAPIFLRQLVNFTNLQRGKCAGETGRGTRCENQFKWVSQSCAAFCRNAGMKIDRQAMLAFLRDGGAVKA